MYYPGQVAVAKEESEYYGNSNRGAESDNHKKHPDPFLYTNSKVMTG